MSLTGRLLKLRAMSASEIRVRIREALRRRRERRLLRHGLRMSASEPMATCGAQGLVKAAASLVPGARRKELDRLQKDCPETSAALAARAASTAQAVLSGAWDLLGYRVDLRGDVDWHRDPRSEYRWPRRFYADVPLDGDAVDGADAGDGGDRVDVKYVCELGRQQYLVELARGWLFTRKEHYAKRARELMLAWIRSNPIYEGVHWTSALEVAMRAISWIWTVATLADWDGWQAGDLERAAASLADHSTYLEHHLSFYSSPYNHLIGEATGLYLIGLVLRERDGASRWRRLGRKVLTDHGPRQFYSDGFCVEQATGYHFYTLGFLSLAIAAARTEGKPLEELECVAQRAYCAGAALRQPDGRWPAIGDVDSARSIPVLHDDFWDFRSLCSLGAALFDDAELKARNEVPGEEIYWILGCDGLARWKNLASAAPPPCTVLTESGYAVARSGDDWLLFDAGPIAEGLHADATPSTAHGHADALQVLFWTGNRPVLVDSGMPFYVGPKDWVRHFRSPAAHNTLAIEGADAVRDAGGLDWSHAAERPRFEVNFSDEVWLARGTTAWGRGLLEGGAAVVVERNLLALPGTGLWIADYIQTDRPRRVCWFWQLPAGTVEQMERPDSMTSMVPGDGIVLATWSTSGPLDVRMDTAGETSPAAWNAPGYGVCRKAQRVCQEVEATSGLLVVTYLGISSVPAEVTVRGQRLVCASQSEHVPDLAETAGDAAGTAPAEVIWRVVTERGLLTYLAGVSADLTGLDGVPLVGAGDWPAWSTRRVGSTVCRLETA